MKVLVTGATGFIGTHVVRALQQHDHEVRALIRPQSSAAAHLQTSEIEIVAGDILDAGSCRRAVTGCDAVLHLAADFRLWAPDPGDIVRTNVEGTRNIMQAALTAEVRRVVHTSTIVALDPSPEDPEPRPADPAQLKTPYERSKWEAERLARELAAGRLSLVVVYPTMPLGPEDRKPTPSGRMVIDFLYGRLPFYVNMYLNVAAVEDVAAGHVAALERGRDGEGYILGNRNLTLKDLLDMLARLTGDPAPRGQVPLALARLTALVEENILYRLSGRPPRVSQASVRVAGRRLWCNCQKAINELGLPQTPIEEALARSISWFKSHGYV